jgi:uncharacterized protein YbjT (DUF2867 family)
MTGEQERTIVVTGATGLQSGAVTRRLLSGGWSVRALTRNPQSEKALALAALGAEVVRGDMTDLASLTPHFAGAYGVFSVQNTLTSGIESEIRQGKNVAEAARQAGLRHLVYSSAGTGARGTGIPSWETKLVIEEYLKSLDLPHTILRPMAFMELMTEPKFFPQVSTWQVMPRLMGSDRKVPWLSVEDVGFIAARAFAEPEQFLGQELQLASDVLSIDECRALYRAVMGRNPPRFPMPVWLFERFGIIGKDLGTMWRWLQDGAVDLDTRPTLALHPGALSVRAWMERQARR